MDTSPHLLDHRSQEKLFNEFEILHLVYHRNANQHRTSTWWKSLNVLHRKLRQLLLMLLDVEEITTNGSSRLTKMKWNKLGRIRFTSKRYGKENGEKIAGSIKRKVLKLASYMVHELLPKCYLMCYTILQTGEFITLGFALDGIVSRVYSILSGLVREGLKTARESSATEAVTGAVTETVTEAVAETMTSEDFGMPVEQPPAIEPIKTVVKKHKKRKTAKSTMDDIFGI
ncbi:DEKNAAC103658 [Brettanomyces naardenensis]|uniref:DEKNAAC103658 n=1 Tax=Brettanomyces naardenensis TaxID=13370 RepID=A0A448YNI4_BRENA|nr:DEKNAAC103658 [Brettanomyces naardenensis]